MKFKVQTDKKEQKRKSQCHREKNEQKTKMNGHKFKKKWLSEFMWLDYEEGQMHCKVCRDFPNIADKNSSFSRSKSFHMSNIKGRHQSCRHAKCVEAEKAKEAPCELPYALD